MAQVSYFGQGVGGVFRYPSSNKYNKIIYSDAATSCIICFALSTSKEGENTLVYAHVDCVTALKHFFNTLPNHVQSETVDFWATGAVQSAIGTETYTCFVNDCLPRFQSSDSPFRLNFHTPELIHQSPDKFLHHLGFDVDNKTIVTEHFSLSKLENIPLYGPQCAAYAVKSGLIYWMDETMTLSFNVNYLRNQFVIPKLLWFASLRYKSDEELITESTTPECEPPEFYENSRAGAIWAIEVLQKMTDESIGSQ